MSASITIKRGDTFRLRVQAQDVAGDGVSLAGIAIAAQVRTADGALIDALVVDVTESLDGRFELIATGNSTTEAWPVGQLRIDVQYEQADGPLTIRRSSNTIRLSCIEDVTQ